MGVGSWDDEPRSYNKSPRARRPVDDDPPPGRSYQRSSREGYRGGQDRGPAPSRDGRDRPPRSRDDYGERPPSDRSRSRYDDASDERPGSSGGRSRSAGGSARGSSRGGPPPRSRDEYDDHGSYERRSGRDPRDDGRGGDRSMRGGRPPSREDAWEPPQRTRVRGMDEGGPGASSSRMRGAPRPTGLWEDDELPQRRSRAEMGDPRQRGRDPRGQAYGARGGAGARGAAGDEPSGEKKFPMRRALGILALMLVLGAGAGFAFFFVTTPRVTAPPVPTVPATTAPAKTTPAGTAPAATGTATPHARIVVPAGVVMVVS